MKLKEKKLLYVKNKKSILFLFVFILLSINSFSQVKEDKIRISYSKENISILDFFTFLENEYDLRFSYASDDIKDLIFDVDFKNENIDVVLNELMDITSLEYKLIDNNVLVRKVLINESYNEDNSGPIVIKGKVFTSETNEQLSFASVAISNSSVGTFTNDDGSFILEIPDKYFDENIIVSYLGYEPFIYKISKDKTNSLSFSLKEKKNVIEEIEILNRETSIKIDSKKGIISLNDFQINSITSGINGLNIFKNLQLLPGIVAHNDNSTELEIRGSNGDATLTVLNDIPVYKSSHYFGLFSTINSTYLDSVNIYRTFFPLKYSGKTGGIAEMYTENKIPSKMGLDIDLNLLSTELGIKTPLGRKAAFYISGKTSLNDIGNSNRFSKNSKEDGRKKTNSFKDDVNTNSSDTDMRFLDVQTSLILNPTKNFSAKLSAFYSGEAYENNSSIFITNDINDSLTVVVNEEGNWLSYGVNAKTNLSISKHFNYETNTYVTRLEERNENFARISEQNQSSSNESFLDGDQSDMVFDIGHRQELSFKKNSRKNLIGLEYSRYILNYSFRENNDGVINALDELDKIGLYSSFNNTIGNLSFDIGLRVNYFDKIKQSLISPRILMNVDVGKNLSIKTSYANYQQVIRKIFFEYRSIPMEVWTSSLSNEIPVLRTTNYMIGSTWKTDFFSIDLEAYYKQLKGVTEFVVLDPEDTNNQQNKARDYTLFNGDGRILGLDFIFLTGYNNYETFICYTLSKSEERYSEINDGEFYSSENDRRHQLKWVNSYKYKNFTIGLNAFYSSGLTYTNVSGIDADNNITNRSFERRFNRLPDYQRIDTSIAYDFKIRSKRAKISLSVFNLLNTQNIKYIQSIVTSVEENSAPVSTVVGNEVNFLNRTFNVSFRLSL